MPIYEYVCSACRHSTEILHGINESGPNFCPECGAEGTMRKGFAPPAVVFKGSGWAKKDRRSPPPASGPGKDGDKAGSVEGEPAKSESGASGSAKAEPGGSTSTSSEAKPSTGSSEGG